MNTTIVKEEPVALAAYHPSAVNVANATNTTLGSRTYAKGIYLITASATFPSNTTGRRELWLSTANGSDNDYGIISRVNRIPGPGITQLLQVSDIEEFTSNTTIYFNCYQNSGSTLSCRLYVEAVRLL